MAARDVRRIQRLDWAGLRNLWNGIVQGNTPGWRPGKALEHLVLRAFELDGADVRWPYSVLMDGQEIEQIDGAVHIANLSCLIECKDTSEPINVEPLAKLRNQLLRRPAGTLGVLVSRSGFTSPAQTLAQFLAPQTILLWSGEELDSIIEQNIMRDALLMKYRFCVEHGLPDYDIRAEIVP